MEKSSTGRYCARLREALLIFYVKLLRGRFDLGIYRLRKELRQDYCRVNDKPIFRKVTPPDDIVTNLSLGLAKLKQQVANQNIDLAF